MTQQELGSEDGFRETFLRMVEIEERFQAYREAEIAPELRRDFETLAARLIPRITLQSTEGFSHLAYRSIEQMLAALPERRKRRQLEALVQREPDPHWILMLARLDLEEGERQAAIQRASQVLGSQPQNAEALLIRGLARAAQNNWSLAAQDLAASGQAAESVASAEALLQSYVRLRQWQAASLFLESLPDEIRLERSVALLVAQIARNVGRQAQEQPAPGEGVEALSRARSLLSQSQDRQGQDRTELEEAYALASAVAKKQPNSEEALNLAGEAAYRLGLWQDAVGFLLRTRASQGSPPVPAFYLAVSLFETGERQRAAAVLKTCLPYLRSTEAVESYAEKILSPGQ